MNILLWVLQGLAALLYGASGVMKLFMFDEISKDVPSFGALPRKLDGSRHPRTRLRGRSIVPAAFHWQPMLTGVAALVLAIESVVFIGVHFQYREVATLIMCVVLGLLMAFIAYGRWVLEPIV